MIGYARKFTAERTLSSKFNVPCDLSAPIAMSGIGYNIIMEFRSCLSI